VLFRSVASPGALVTDEDTAIEIDLRTLVQDVETPPDSLAFAVGAATHGTVQLLSDGHTARFTPEAAFPSPAGSGPAGFQYSVTDTGDGPSPPITVSGVPVVVTVRNRVDFSGRVFDDLNNDGVQNAGEVGIAGVTVEVRDQVTDRRIASAVTGIDGVYLLDAHLGPGTYKLVEIQPGGYLDGKETAGNLGGNVDNSQDSNAITDIVFASGAPDGSGYNFADIHPSRIQGLVWEDFNDDGEVNFGEEAIAGVEVRLTGTDDRGSAVDLLMQTDEQGIFEFDIEYEPQPGVYLRPGTYRLIEAQPAGYADGQDVVGTVNRVVSGSNAVNDQISGIVLPGPGADGVNYNFGERPLAGGAVSQGQTATIGFWQNKHGQTLIKSLNGGPTSTQLGDWLAATFQNMYGNGAGTSNLSGMSNAAIADVYTSLFKRNGKTTPGGPPKLDAQVLAVALAVYATNENLAGTTATAYGFRVTANGVGTSTFDVGNANRAAFGLSATDSTVMTVLDTLLATDDKTRKGMLYDLDGSGTISTFERALREMANQVYTVINEQGHIA
jgi:hypothetical protein